MPFTGTRAFRTRITTAAPSRTGIPARRPPSPRHPIPRPPDLAARDSATDPLDRLFESVYDELRRLAHRRLGAERDDHTLSTTALVHEVYLRMSSQSADAVRNREQFFALAAQAMRRILVDYARRHRAIKRPQQAGRVSLSHLEAADAPWGAALDDGERADFLLALDEALEELRALDDRLARVVEYRFFTGLTEAETAALLGVTSRTVARDWVRARAWLYRRLAEDGESPEAGRRP